MCMNLVHNGIVYYHSLIKVTAMRTLLLALVLMLAGISLSAQTGRTDTVSTVRIGNQVWMKYNVAATTFRNGDSIAYIPIAKEWAISGQYGIPAYVAYGNEPDNLRRYGLLYNYFAVTDPRGLCPNGFRVPSDADWRELEQVLTRDAAAQQLKSSSGWLQNGNGADAYHFSALPGGFRTQTGAFFLDRKVGYWWTNTIAADSSVTAILLFDYDPKIFRIQYRKEKGMSLRCIRE